MLRAGTGTLSVVALVTMAAMAADPPPASTPTASKGQPADFKLVLHLYGVDKKPVKKVEMLVRGGKVFRFDAEPTLEAIIFDPAARKLDLLDLGRKRRTDLPLERLNIFQSKLYEAIDAASAKREAEGGKGNEVAAAMSRDLIEPHYAAEYDARTHTVRLSNSSIQFEGTGEPEPDRQRLAFIAEMLAIFMKLESMREPTGIPPFSRLEALRVMTDDHQLRPTDITFIFRLVGPPRKYRWTFQLEPVLTEREVEGVSVIEQMKSRCRYERFDRYERSEKAMQPRKSQETSAPR